MARAYEEVTADVLALSNRLREQLHRYFPQFLELGTLHDEAWIREMIELALTPASLGRLRRDAVQKLLRRHRIRRIDAAGVLEVLRRPPLPVAPGVTEAASARVTLLLPRLNVAARQRDVCYARLEKLIQEVGKPAEHDNSQQDIEPPGKQHRDAEILLSLPGVGIVTGATMLTEASMALNARDYQNLRTVCGLAPVTQQTGKRRLLVSMRRACNPRLRYAVYHWARVSTQHDPKARAHYARLRASGHSHGRALRGVADRLLAVAVAMLKSDTLCDPSRRLALGAGTPPAPPAQPQL